MFCNQCGSRIDGEAKFCANCGAQVARPETNNGNCGGGQCDCRCHNQPATSQATAPTENTLAIVGFVLSFFCSIAGLICSIIGYKAAKNNGAPHKGLAIAGIVVSALELAGTVLVFLIWFFWLFALMMPWYC